MVKLNELVSLEKASRPDLAGCEVVFEAERDDAIHQILKCGDKLYYRKAAGADVTCFQILIDWIPKPGEIRYAYTPDDKHFCTIITCLAQARELAEGSNAVKSHISFEVRTLKPEQVSVGDSCFYDGRTITVVDDTQLQFNSTVIRVTPSSEFTYKLNRKCISAIGGARGLYAFLEQVSAENRYFNKHYPLWSAVWNIIFEHFKADPQ